MINEFLPAADTIWSDQTMDKPPADAPEALPYLCYHNDSGYFKVYLFRQQTNQNYTHYPTVSKDKEKTAILKKKMYANFFQFEI